MHRFAFMWLVYSRNKFSEWVQIFQKNSFRGEPILGGSKLNVTSLRWLVFCCACLLSVILSEVGLRISNRVHNVCQAHEQLTWSPVSCYMECGAVRQQEVKKIADVANGYSCLSPAFISILKVCANLPTALFDKG